MNAYAIAVQKQLDAQTIPPETCPTINKVIKALRKAQKIADASLRDDEVEELHSAIRDIDWELSGLEYELETLREHNATLRELGKAWYALAVEVCDALDEQLAAVTAAEKEVGDE